MHFFLRRYDPSLTFSNLREGGGVSNLLSEGEISGIWVPRILFVNSPKREKSAITLEEPGRETVGER